jgi:hypothetical protein
VRVLVAYEEIHRVYGEALGSAIRRLRPHAEVEVFGLSKLEPWLERFEPHLVVSSSPNTVDHGGRVAWCELSPEPDGESYSCIDGRRTVSENPGLEELLRIVDETEEQVRTGCELGGC